MTTEFSILDLIIFVLYRDLICCLTTCYVLINHNFTIYKQVKKSIK